MSLDSFDRLREGDTFETECRTVSDADVASFDATVAEGQQEHLGGWSDSAEPAARIVPGMLTVALSLALAGARTGGAVALRGISDVAFTRPVAVGDTLSVTGRIAKLTPMDARAGIVALVLLTGNQDGKLVCRARVQLLWRR